MRSLLPCIGLVLMACSSSSTTSPAGSASASLHAAIAAPTKEDVRLVLKARGYYATSVSSTRGQPAFDMEGHGPDGRTFALDLVAKASPFASDRLARYAKEGAKTVELSGGLTIALSVERQGSADGAATDDLMNALLAGAGKAPLAVQIRPDHPPTWKIADMLDEKKLVPMLDHAGYQQGMGAHSLDTDKPGNTGLPEAWVKGIRTDGVQGDIEATVTLKCERKESPPSSYPVIDDFPSGSYVFIDGSCSAAVEAENKQTKATSSEAAQKLLLALLAQSE